MRSPLRHNSSSRQDIVAPAIILLLLVLLAGCGGGDGIVLPGEGEAAAIAVVDGDEQLGRVGEPLNEPVVVQVTDSRGRPVEGAMVAFEFSSAGAGAAVVPQEKATDGDGLADAQLVLGTSIGRQTGQARVVLEGRGPILASFSATALPENANSMAAVAGQDQTGHVGLPLDDRLVVEVTDGFGNPVAGVPITWEAVGGGSVSEAVVPTGEDGRSRVDRTLGPTVGEQTTVASAEGLAGSPVTFVHTALAGDASRLVIISGNDQIAGPGSMLPAELVVQLIDAEGNGVPQTAVSWVVATGGGAATPENSTTDADGRTSARWTLGGALGQQRLDAVVSGVGIASFHATATAVAPPSLFIRTQPSASARNGVPLSRQPVVQLRDSRGNDVAQAGVQVTAAIGSGGGELGGARQAVTDASGRATFTNLSISGAPGRRTLRFTASGYAQVTSSEIDLEAIETTTTITGDSPDPSGVGSPFTVSFRAASEGPTPTGSVTVSDGNQSCSGSLSIGAGSCQLTLSTAGNRTLTATYASAPGLLGSSDTEPHAVTAAPPPPPAATTTTITGDSPDPSVAGSAVTVSFQVTSGGGTPTGSVTVTVSGGGPSCTGELSGGSGSCQITLGTVGDRTLTATYSGGSGFSASSDTEAHGVNAPEPDNEAPDADYNWHCEGLTCQFTDASEDDDGSVVSWSWNFDGTGASNLQNPSHTFPGPGEYEVTLTVTDNRGASDETTAGVEVDAPPPPNQPPTAEFTSRCDELECDFESGSRDPDGRIENYDWTFGDGGTSDDDDPEHEYSTDGTYQVTLTVTDDDGATSTVTHSVTVAEEPSPNQEPEAGFAASCQDLICTFTDQSSDPDNDIVSWTWDFGDGTSSTERNPPPHTYAPGEYTVRLTVRDDNNASDEHTEQVTVSEPAPANTPPTAAFTAPTDCVASQPCQFTDGSSDSDGMIRSRVWNFQDGTPTTPTDPNPSVTFSTDGSKTVTLTVTDDDGEIDTETKQVTVSPASTPGSLGLREQPPNRARSGELLEDPPEVELLSSTSEDVKRAGVPVSVAVLGATVGLSGPTTRETDDNGRAEFEDLAINGPSGSIVTLTFSAPGFAPVDSQPITIIARDDNGNDDDG